MTVQIACMVRPRRLWTLLDGVTPLLHKLVLGIAAISGRAVCGCIAGVLGSDCTVRVARGLRRGGGPDTR